MLPPPQLLRPVPWSCPLPLVPARLTLACSSAVEDARVRSRCLPRRAMRSHRMNMKCSPHALRVLPDCRYEGMKKVIAFTQGSETTPTQGATCGSIAGAVSAAATCPLDVVKTRMMLGAKTKSGEPYAGRGTWNSLQTIVKEEGALALFAGIGPRVGWITIGGFVFFGAYEKAQEVLWKTGVWGEKPKFAM
jgi:hypothetical protein